MNQWTRVGVWALALVADILSPRPAVAEVGVTRGGDVELRTCLEKFQRAVADAKGGVSNGVDVAPLKSAMGALERAAAGEDNLAFERAAADVSTEWGRFRVALEQAAEKIKAARLAASEAVGQVGQMADGVTAEVRSQNRQAVAEAKAELDQAAADLKAALATGDAIATRAAAEQFDATAQFMADTETAADASLRTVSLDDGRQAILVMNTQLLNRLLIIKAAARTARLNELRSRSMGKAAAVAVTLEGVNQVIGDISKMEVSLSSVAAEKAAGERFKRILEQEQRRPGAATPLTPQRREEMYKAYGIPVPGQTPPSGGTAGAPGRPALSAAR